jgi:gamma-D-glutamyl-L-lysine dipeptidyl-peptidase
VGRALMWSGPAPVHASSVRTRTVVILLATGAAVVSGCGAAAGLRPAASADAAGSRRPAPARSPGRPAYVDVAVATLWVRPGIARPIDRPALTHPVDMAAWQRALATTARRAWLVGRLETQALYGTRVLVTGRSGSWLHVVVPSQPTPRDARGYPGWLPAVQVTDALTLDRYAHGRVAVVTKRVAWLRTTAGARTIRLSFGTRLAVVGASTAGVEIATPNGGTRVVGASAVRVYPRRSAIPTPTGAQVVRTARRFVGLRYLWAGVSGWGFDCSGLTYAVYHRFGVRLPRDAQDQAASGRAVSRGALAPGDLVFFAGPGGTGAVHHVAVYAGGGDIIESPNSAASVRVVPLASEMGSFAGARRIL